MLTKWEKNQLQNITKDRMAHFNLSGTVRHHRENNK